MTEPSSTPEPEPIAGYLRNGDPYYADGGLEDAYEDLHELILERLGSAADTLSFAAVALTDDEAGRALWPQWRAIVEAMIKRNEQRARSYLEHEAEVLAELERDSEA